MKPNISYADFAKLDMRIGTIVECETVEKSDKLLKLLVDLGDPPAGGGQKTILSGIKKHFKPEELIGTQVLVLANLEPKKMMGLESQGMILMGVEKSEEQEGEEVQEEKEKITLLIPKNTVAEGTGVE